MIFYLILGLPVAILRFIGFNFLALFQLGTMSHKDLWSKDGAFKVFVHPSNLLIGVIIVVVIIFIDKLL